MSFATVVLVCFGAAFFLGHLAWAIYAFRFYTARDDKLEAAGKVIPGIPGLLLVAVALAPSVWTVTFAVLAFPLSIVGQGIYQCIVFRKKK